MSRRGVVVIGDVMVDIIVRPEGPLRRGTDRRAAIRSHPGGSGANQAAWLAAMGIDTVLVARVGQAEAGSLESHLRGLGVVPYLARDDARATGTLINLIDPDGERSFLTDRGANLGLCAEDLPQSLYQKGAAVLVSGYSLFAEAPRRAVQDFIAGARRAGLLVAVDASSSGFIEEVGAAAFLDWTQGIDLLFANGDEAALLSGASTTEAQIERLGRHFATVVVKRGAGGAVAGTADGITAETVAEAVAVVDTTGAGDAFAAGFLAAHLWERSLAQALAAGVAAGTEAVKVAGGQPPPGIVPVIQD
jgi:sugar/nucleoside kinase (ribokinase family)